MTLNNVQDWLEESGLGAYKEQFLLKKIKGNHLKKMTYEYLTQELHVSDGEHI